MTAPELMCRIIGINLSKLSKAEILIAEAEFLSHLYDELRENFRIKFKRYFNLMKFSVEIENEMLDANFFSCLVNDILITNQYTVEGIAYYTNSFEDVIEDIAAGKNIHPSFSLARQIIDLHRTVRPSLYKEIINKITPGTG